MEPNVKQALVCMEYIRETVEFGNRQTPRSWEKGWLEGRFRLLLWWGDLMKQAILRED